MAQFPAADFSILESHTGGIMQSLGRLFALTLFTVLFAPAVPAAGLTFGAVVDQLKPDKMTKLELKETWKKLKGQEVNWSGKVVDVSDGRKSAKIYLIDGSRKNYKGYNIILAVKDKDAAAKLKRGQSIRFKGTLHDFDPRSNGSITVDLRDAQVL